MDVNSRAASGKLRWFCWISRVLLVAAGLIPLVDYFRFYVFVVPNILPKGTAIPWGSYTIIFLGLLLANSFVAWKAPIFCGILAGVAIVSWLFWEWWYILTASPAKWDWYYYFRNFLLLEWFLLFFGGILSIVWGIMKRKHIRTQSNPSLPLL